MTDDGFPYGRQARRTRVTASGSGLRLRLACTRGRCQARARPIDGDACAVGATECSRGRVPVIRYDGGVAGVLHGHCDDMPPAEFEAAFYAAQQTDPARVGSQ